MFQKAKCRLYHNKHPQLVSVVGSGAPKGGGGWNAARLQPTQENCGCATRPGRTKHALTNHFSSISFNSWIKRDQLDVTCFIISLFNAQHVSDVNTSILRSLRLIFWVILWVVLLWFDGCWCYVVVWGGVVSGYHTTPPQPNHNVTPTPIEPEQYNP